MDWEIKARVVLDTVVILSYSLILYMYFSIGNVLFFVENQAIDIYP